MKLPKGHVVYIHGKKFVGEVPDNLAKHVSEKPLTSSKKLSENKSK